MSLRNKLLDAVKEYKKDLDYPQKHFDVVDMFRIQIKIETLEEILEELDVEEAKSRIINLN